MTASFELNAEQLAAQLDYYIDEYACLAIRIARVRALLRAADKLRPLPEAELPEDFDVLLGLALEITEQDEGAQL